MSRAYRLIVVWMAGALGTLVVYGAHRLHVGEVGVPPPAPPSVPLTSVDDARLPISQYLNARYDRIDHFELGYFDEPVEEIDDPALRRFLPDTRFFLTKLVTYPKGPYVSLLVSFRAADGDDAVRSCLTGKLTQPSRRFLSQFLWLPAPTLEARRKLALAIAQLFADGAMDGSARVGVDPHHRAGRAEVWWGHWAETHWRDIDVFSDENGRVNRIAMTNAGEHTPMMEASWP